MFLVLDYEVWETNSFKKCQLQNILWTLKILEKSMSKFLYLRWELIWRKHNIYAVPCSCIFEVVKTKANTILITHVLITQDLPGIKFLVLNNIIFAFQKYFHQKNLVLNLFLKDLTDLMWLRKDQYTNLSLQTSLKLSGSFFFFIPSSRCCNTLHFPFGLAWWTSATSPWRMATSQRAIMWGEPSVDHEKAILKE